MSELKESFANFLRRTMQEKEISESELARRSKITQPTINRILNGNVGGYRLDTMQALAKALGLDPVVVVAAAIKDDFEDIKNKKFEFYAENFNASDLSEKEWSFIEKHFQKYVDDYQAAKKNALIEFLEKANKAEEILREKEKKGKVVTEADWMQARQDPDSVLQYPAVGKAIKDLRRGRDKEFQKNKGTTNPGS